MKSDLEIAAESVSRIRQLLAEWLVVSAESRKPVAEILQLLEPLDSYIRREVKHPISGRTTRKDGGSGRGDGTTYTVSKQKNELELLTEHREGGSSQPYRVPKATYETVVEVLAHAEAPYAFAAVMEATVRLRVDAPAWQVRTVLRFLLNAQPPLIVRERNRYRAEDAAKLGAEAKRLWRQLLKQAA